MFSFSKMSRELVNPIRDLFDAAVRHNTIKVSCRCGNVGIFDPHALWWLFERRGWNDRLGDVQRRMRCLQCYVAKRKRTRAATADARYQRVEAAASAATVARIDTQMRENQLMLPA